MALCIIIGGLNPGSQTIITPGAGSFVVPVYTRSLRVRGWGAGGGGNGITNSGSAVTEGTNGGSTTFSPPPGVLTAGGGTRAFFQSGFNYGNPGTASGGDINTSGEFGGYADFQATNIGRGGAAANVAQGGGDYAQIPQTSARKHGVAGNSYGGGGSGATSFISGSGYFSGGGGGGGAFVEKVYQPGDLNAGSSIAYVVGAGGAGGVNTWIGGAGADGALVIEWDY